MCDDFPGGHNVSFPVEKKCLIFIQCRCPLAIFNGISNEISNKDKKQDVVSSSKINSDNMQELKKFWF